MAIRAIRLIATPSAGSVIARTPPFSPRSRATGSRRSNRPPICSPTLRANGIPTAAVSASENAEAVLKGAEVAQLFDVRVDGLDATALDLAGKPDPAIFLEAARRLGVQATHAAVVEDALAGVEAGRRGGFGLVVGCRSHRPSRRPHAGRSRCRRLGSRGAGRERRRPLVRCAVSFDRARPCRMRGTMTWSIDWLRRGSRSSSTTTAL